MGHQVVSCPNCRTWVMEGSNDWKCDCGHVMSLSTGWVWKNPDGLTLEERCKRENQTSQETSLLTDSNFKHYAEYIDYCKQKRKEPMSFKEYIDYLSFF